MAFTPTRATQEEIKIQEGDTLNSIANVFDTSVEELVKLNNIKDVNKIETGENLIIPKEYKYARNGNLKNKKNFILPINVRQFLKRRLKRAEVIK